MTKMAMSFDLALAAPKPGAVLFRWLYNEIRAAILDGRLKRGTRLPSTRELARRYGLSRGTVVTAFEQLHSEGYLEGKVGEGTRVNTLLPEDLLQAKRPNVRVVPVGKSRPVLSRYAHRLISFPDIKPTPPRAFRALTPAFDAFPLALWTQIASRRLRRATRSLLGDVCPRGYWPLRVAVAEYLGSARGVRCTADQVIIVAGIQQALDLTARLAVDPGDAVWLEDPCAPIVPEMFKALGARIIPVPVDECGLNIEEGVRCCPRARLAYVTPAHQFPLGGIMTVDRRLALLDWARRTRALIFEDDYDSEYRYSGLPIPALQGLDQTGAVVYSGSFSKMLFPTLRLGFLVVSPELVDKFASARLIMDRHSSVIDQAILCDFITEGHFGRHIRRMREVYAGRLAVLRESVERQVCGVLRIPEVEAGVHTVGWLADGLDAATVAQVAAANNVEVAPLNAFTLKSPVPQGLLLGFGAVDHREIRRGVEVLAAVIEKSTKAA
jgi:GntR family transcriptional regulator / MocR family aminotransferase